MGASDSVQPADANPMSTLDIALDFVFSMEGGFSDDPNDPGGRTMYGISERAHPEAWKNGPPTKDDAKEIYVRHYWIPLELDRLDNHFAILVMDTAVNVGVPRVRKWLDNHSTFHSFLARRTRYYTDLSTWDTFGKGWTRRIAALIKLLDDLPRTADMLIDNRPTWRRVMDALYGMTGPVRFRVRLLATRMGTKIDVEAN